MRTIKTAKIRLSNGRVAILDTCELYPGTFEIMLLYHNSGEEIDSATAADEASAVKDFYRIREKHEVKLYGKYEELCSDLKEAVEVGKKAAIDLGNDGGSCNFDSPAISLTRWNRNMVETAAKEAGVGCFRWNLTGDYVFPMRLCYQGNANTAAAEAARNYLLSKGYDASVYYQID